MIGHLGKVKRSFGRYKQPSQYGNQVSKVQKKSKTKGNPPCHLEENEDRFTVSFSQEEKQLKISFAAGDTLEGFKA